MDKKNFVSLLTANYHRISSFVFSMVPHHADAEEVLQESTALMWEKFENFDPGTDFVAWALTIARYRILSHYRDQSRSQLQLSDNVLELIDKACRARHQSENTNQKRDALRECLKILSQKEARVIELKYSESLSTKKLSERLGVSIPTAYRYLSRIYDRLLHCVKQRLRYESSG